MLFLQPNSPAYHRAVWLPQPRSSRVHAAYHLLLRGCPPQLRSPHTRAGAASRAQGLRGGAWQHPHNPRGQHLHVCWALLRGAPGGSSAWLHGMLQRLEALKAEVDELVMERNAAVETVQSLIERSRRLLQRTQGMEQFAQVKDTEEEAEAAESTRVLKSRVKRLLGKTIERAAANHALAQKLEGVIEYKQRQLMEMIRVAKHSELMDATDTTSSAPPVQRSTVPPPTGAGWQAPASNAARSTQQTAAPPAGPFAGASSAAAEGAGSTGSQGSSNSKQAARGGEMAGQPRVQGLKNVGGYAGSLASSDTGLGAAVGTGGPQERRLLLSDGVPGWRLPTRARTGEGDAAASAVVEAEVAQWMAGKLDALLQQSSSTGVVDRRGVEELREQLDEYLRRQQQL